jgi:NTE family protein
MPRKISHRTALVLSGGGARGAYEAGVLHYLRTAIPPKLGGGHHFEVQCGSSVGGINICFMASMEHDPLQQGQKIYHLWRTLKQDQIYKRNIGALGSFLGRTTKGISLNLLKLNPFSSDPDKKKEEVHFRGFLDTSPLPEFLKRIDFRQIGRNIKKGFLDAVTLTATNIAAGRMELFIEKKASVEYTGEYAHHLTELACEHAMASAAIPIIFPPVMVKNIYYTDGGLKLNTPMSPAIQLGASKIFIIGLHHHYHPGEQLMYAASPSAHPTLGQLVGQVMNALFLDRIQYDIEQLTRINRLVEWSIKVYGKDYLDKINNMLLKEGIRGDIANRGLRKLQVFNITPSKDIAELFAECYDEVGAKESFTAFEKMLLRLLDIDPKAGVDILSYLSFMPTYLKRLLALGYEDAEAHREQIIEFLMAEA